MNVQLKPFLRHELDVLFIALSPPRQSNANGHYFSGGTSRFFHLLAHSGLTVREVPKSNADEIVFGGTSANYNCAAFGVVDLVEYLIETDSTRVQPSSEDVAKLLGRIHEYRPRFACIIHSKVLSALSRWGKLNGKLGYGYCGRVLSGCDTEFVVNYFPNGNAVSDVDKLAIFGDLRCRLRGDT